MVIKDGLPPVVLLSERPDIGSPGLQPPGTSFSKHLNMEAEKVLEELFKGGDF